MSRLEQHERMLAARERERLEKERGEISSRNSNHHSQQRPRYSFGFFYSSAAAH